MKTKAMICYNIDDMDLKIMERILQQRQIGLQLMDAGMLAMQVSEVLEKKPLSNQDCARFGDSFVLMNGLDDQDIQEIFQQAEQAGWQCRPIMMVVTEHNRNWTVAKLLDEVSREHRLLMKAGELSELLHQADRTERKGWPQSQIDRNNRAMMQGFMLLKSQHYDESNLQQAIDQLRQSLQPCGE